MRMLFVFDISFDRPSPSVHLLQDILRQALLAGHNVDVILKKFDDNAPDMAKEFCDNKNFRYTCIKDEPVKKGFISRYLHEIEYTKKCYKVYKHNTYDIAFLQSCNTALFALNKLKTLGCPVVFNVQDIFPYNLYYSKQLPVSKITFPVFRMLQHLAYKKASSIITISDDMKRTLIKDGIEENKISVVYNWSYGDNEIKLDNINPEDIYDFKETKNETSVVYAGNIGKMQNVELIVNAAKLTGPEIHYYIIGEGANKGTIEDMSKGMNNISILPMQPSNKAESIYAQADINIIPLMPGGIFTALPSKTATCLRVRKPIVFCIDKESDFYKMLSDEKNVAVADCSSPEELAEKIKELSGRVDSDSMDATTSKLHKLISRNNAHRYVEIMEQSGD